MTLDARARATAQKMMAKYGKACTLYLGTQGAYDPATGTVSNTMPAGGFSYPVNALMTAPNSQDLDGGQVVETDEVAIFPALGLDVEPTPNDTLIVDDIDRTIKQVTKVWSGAQVALWRVVLAS